MKLTAMLLLGLLAGALAATTPTKKKNANISSNRQKRLFFPKISSAIADWIGLGVEKSVTVSKQPVATRPIKVIYVPKNDQTRARNCKTPFTDDDCLGGYVCSLAHTCVPKSPNGQSCLRSAQCLGGTCRDYICVKDACHTAGQQSNCPSHQTCVTTSTGRVCRPKDDSCSMPMSWVGCPSGQYCGTNKHCQPKLPVNAVCRLGIQCQHNICRNHRCKNDVCPTIHSSFDCEPTQYCASTTKGKVCEEKLANGKQCKSDNQCQSHRCENKKCVLHACLSADDCLPHQYCKPEPQGNMCSETLSKGADCSMAIMCKSGQCIKGHCFDNECDMPMTSDGCSMNNYCMFMKNGNTCMMKLPNNAHCRSNIQCLSNFCLNGSICKPDPNATTTPTSTQHSSHNQMRR